MFDGDQFHQFIASSRSSLPIPLSFSLHGNNPSFSAAFDPYPHLHHQEPPPAAAKKAHMGAESERSTDPWSNDEVLALLKVRSSMEIWFPDFTWEHLSRKLAELGFKRSEDECKDKFEDESRQFNSAKSYRIFGEFDEFYAADHHLEARNSSKSSDDRNSDQQQHDNAEQSEPAAEEAPKPSCGKRKRKDKFEMFKGFCEAVLKKMMAQQEEMHNKLIDDIVKRDDEKIAREEAWKNLEMDRIRTEIELRTKEQATAAQRQATIINFLKKFISDSDQNLKNKLDCLINTTSSSRTPEKNPSSSLSQNSPKKPTKTITPSSPSSVLAPKNTNSNPNTPSPLPVPVSVPVPPYVQTTESTTTTTPSSTSNPDSTKTGSDTGKRWPREEVLALISLRCKVSNNTDDNKEAGAKGPLWERISQGMVELGYKRSAKRCKEKWENINKYFRKTKDSSKKRSVNSRTCPYFQQLSCLYSDGGTVAPSSSGNQEREELGAP